MKFGKLFSKRIISVICLDYKRIDSVCDHLGFFSHEGINLRVAAVFIVSLDEVYNALGRILWLSEEERPELLLGLALESVSIVDPATELR